MYETEEIKPYGLIVKTTEVGATVKQFSPDTIHNWLQQHRIIIFRGFDLLPKNEFALYAQTLGEPLQWVFGAINELKVKPDAKNYIYTDRAVPFHWDGAFVKKIPHVIMFQCIKAPPATDKGGTTFVDTIGLIKSLPKEKLEDWRRIHITYRTEKIAHYGGKITQQLVAPHPVTGEEVLRYAEPVADINPVWLDIHGFSDAEQENFIAEMKQLLYAPEHYYVHQWKDGDIVFADNHTLLHGREAFENISERFIQRINVLKTPENNLRTFIRRSLIIRRKEFFVAELPIFIIPVLLCVANWSVFTDINFWMGISAGFLLFNIGDMINCYADAKLDAVYKSHLSYAVLKLGKKNIVWQMALSGLVAMGLTAVIAIDTGRYYLVPLTLVGGFVGLQYSIGPFHFKRRGIWQLLCLWGIIFWGPMLYISITTNGFPSMALLILYAAYGFHQMGIILLNTAEDYTEDKEAGLNTIIVSLGLHRAMGFALWLIIISGLVMQSGFAYLYSKFGMPPLFYIGILPFTIAWLYIVYGFRKIVLSILGLNEVAATEEIKKNGAKVPEWLKLGAYTALIAAFIIFIYRIYLQQIL